MRESGNVTMLVVGILVGVFGGFLLGALLGRSVFQMIGLLVQSITRSNRSDEDRMKFELLLQ